jgi:hypothetical protein
MGGQACVFYGAAEFSRDCDIVLLADDANLLRLRTALDALDAVCIAVPPFEKQFLERGHAVHFRCRHPEASQMRVDVMTKLRGCGPFAELWERRLTLQDSEGGTYEILGIEDLVIAKKTQRDKDWPMIQRLVDAHYEANRDRPSAEQVRFWLRESRTSSVLIELAKRHADEFKQMLPERPLLQAALIGDKAQLERLLIAEAAEIRAADRAYWQPLIEELRRLRESKRSRGPETRH